MLSTVALGALLSAPCGTGVDDEAVPTSTVAATPTATGVPVALAVPRAIPKRTSTLVAQLAPPTAASPTPRVVATPTQTPIPATTRPLSNYLKMARRHCRRNHRSAHASCNTPR